MYSGKYRKPYILLYIIYEWRWWKRQRWTSYLLDFPSIHSFWNSTNSLNLSFGIIIPPFVSPSSICLIIRLYYSSLSHQYIAFPWRVYLTYPRLFKLNRYFLTVLYEYPVYFTILLVVKADWCWYNTLIILRSMLLNGICNYLHQQLLLLVSSWLWFY